MNMHWWVDLPWKLKAVLGSMRRDLTEIRQAIAELKPLISALEQKQKDTTNDLRQEVIEKLRLLEETEMPLLAQLFRGEAQSIRDEAQSLRGEIREQGLLAETAARQSQRAAAETRIRSRLIPPLVREEGLSVLITNWNHARLLGLATASACAALDALPAGGEVLILDDASRDGSREVAHELARADERIGLILCDENLGLPRARNVLLCQARYKHAMILDSDNQLEPRGVATLYASSLETAAVLAFGNVLQVDESGSVVGVMSNERATPDLAKGNWIDAMVMVRTGRMLELGGYDCHWLYGLEDWELNLRLLRLGEPIVFVPVLVGKYRMSRLSMVNEAPATTRYQRVANVCRRGTHGFRAVSHVHSSSCSRVPVEKCWLACANAGLLGPTGRAAEPLAPESSGSDLGRSLELW